MDTLLRERNLYHLLRRSLRIRPSPSRRVEPKSHDGISRTIRLGRQLEVVHADFDNTVFEQGGSFQGEIGAESIGKLFSGL